MDNWQPSKILEILEEKPEFPQKLCRNELEEDSPLYIFGALS
jgi:hypothetical protein